jgi:hypothetical protein
LRDRQSEKLISNGIEWTIVAEFNETSNYRIPADLWMRSDYDKSLVPPLSTAIGHRPSPDCKPEGVAIAYAGRMFRFSRLEPKLALCQEASHIGRLKSGRKQRAKASLLLGCRAAMIRYSA